MSKTKSVVAIYNIIGDIHGRDAWKRLVDEDCINIFVGDYFDPYHYIPFKELERNFMAITAYKKEHRDKVVLLYGNHDLEYLPATFERTDRYNGAYAKRIRWLFANTEDMFDGVAYAIGDDYLVSHAGVTWDWKDTYLPKVDDVKPSSIAKAINDLWSKEKRPFTFSSNSKGNEDDGEDPRHSPLWVRPEPLCVHNLYRGSSVKQIVGHTRLREIVEVAGVIMVDCLDTVEQSYKVWWPQ